MRVRCTSCGWRGWRVFCAAENETYVCKRCGMDESGLSFYKARIIKPRELVRKIFNFF